MTTINRPASLSHLSRIPQIHRKRFRSLCWNEHIFFDAVAAQISHVINGGGHPHRRILYKLCAPKATYLAGSQGEKLPQRCVLYISCSPLIYVSVHDPHNTGNTKFRVRLLTQKKHVPVYLINQRFLCTAIIKNIRNCIFCCMIR